MINRVLVVTGLEAIVLLLLVLVAYVDMRYKRGQSINEWWLIVYYIFIIIILLIYNLGGGVK